MVGWGRKLIARQKSEIQWDTVLTGVPTSHPLQGQMIHIKCESIPRHYAVTVTMFSCSALWGIVLKDVAPMHKVHPLKKYALT